MDKEKFFTHALHLNPNLELDGPILRSVKSKIQFQFSQKEAKISLPGRGQLDYTPTPQMRGSIEPPSIPLPLLYLRIVKSGWNKPSTLLAGLFWLERNNLITLSGRRRLNRLLTSQSTEILFAGLKRSERLDFQRNKILLQWVNRPFYLRNYRPKEKRRIGKGYTDKGSTLPLHKSGRNKTSESSIFLGEKQAYFWNMEAGLALKLRDFREHLVQIGKTGYWEPDIILTQHLRLLNYLSQCFSPTGK